MISIHCCVLGVDRMVWVGLYSPDRVSSEYSTREKHANIHRRSLDDCPDGYNHTHQLHEPDAAELVADKGLRQGTAGLAGNINSDDLGFLGSVLELRGWVLTAPVRPLDGFCM